MLNSWWKQSEIHWVRKLSGSSSREAGSIVNHTTLTLSNSRWSAICLSKKLHQRISMHLVAVNHFIASQTCIYSCCLSWLCTRQNQLEQRSKLVGLMVTLWCHVCVYTLPPLYICTLCCCQSPYSSDVLYIIISVASLTGNSWRWGDTWKYVWQSYAFLSDTKLGTTSFPGFILYE